MEIIAKCAAAAILVSVSCLLIKRYNPEISFIMGSLLSTLILVSALGMFSVVKELIDCAVDVMGASSTYIRPMLKCMGIGLISKFAADICRDASQNAAASSIELAGTLCAASVAMPMIISTLKMIGTMV